MVALTTTAAMGQSVFIIENSDHVKGRVLDAGCGYKPWKRYFDLRGIQTDWVGLDLRPGIGDITASVEDIPEPDESFDFVICADVLGFVGSPHTAARELYRVLKPGCWAIATLPVVAPDTGGLFRFTQEGGKLLFEQAGFSVDRIKRIGGLMVNEIENLRMIGKQLLPLPAEFEGWVEQLDSKYPMFNGYVLLKGENSGQG